jgi:hypothetical protein
MNVFFSYAREDRQKVELLAARLQSLGHQIWLDRELTGGQPWWDVVLRQLQRADAVVLALSPASLRSQACGAELWYTQALARPVLPVMVERIPPDALPPDLARLQVVDYVMPGEESAFALARAVAQLPPAPPLPQPLPPPPAVPLSYLSRLAQQIAAPSLSIDEQLALVSKLELGMKSADDEERTAAWSLLSTLMRRRDLYQETGVRGQRLLVGQAPTPPVAAVRAAGSRAVTTPPGQTTGTPGWVKGLAWVGGIVVVLFIIGIIAAIEAEGPGPDPGPNYCTDSVGYVYPC